MMRKPLSALLLLSAALGGCINEDQPENSGIEVGDPLPAFSVTLSDGLTVNNRTLEGKVGVIEFFNTSCSDCREFFPVFEEVYDEFADNPDVTVFSIAREEDEASILAYWNANALTVPFSAQTDRRVYNLFATVGIPRVYISDRQGIVRYVFTDADYPDSNQIISDILTLLDRNNTD